MSFPTDMSPRAMMRETLMQPAPLHARFPIGTVLRIGHPLNHVAWIRLPTGWTTNDGFILDPVDMYDILEHRAFEVLVRGLPG